MSDSSMRTQPPPPNVLGIVGFVASLLGLVTCGMLSPVGLVLSVIALFKTPRGFAIAGTVISLIGSAVLTFWGFLFVMGILGLKAVAETGIESLATVAVLAEARQAVEGERRASGSTDVLDDTRGNEIAGRFKDGWGQPLRYERQGDTFRILSAGMDKAFGTTDDIDLDDPNLEKREQNGAPK
jgi:hypothetical protein